MGLTTGMVCSDGLVILVGIVIMAVGPGAVSVWWTDYSVDTGSLLGNTSVGSGVAGWNSSSEAELQQLYSRWPQMFYSRNAELHKTCFPSLNESVWSTVFRRKAAYCVTGSKSRRTRVCFCMSIEEYMRPLKGSSSYKLSDDQLTLHNLYNAAFMLLATACGCNFLLMICMLRISSSPKVVGTLGLILVVFEVCATPVALILYSIAENLELSIVLPPHLGFIHTNKDINEATKANRTHGFYLCCSMVALVLLCFALYLWSLLPRRGKPDAVLWFFGCASGKRPADGREMTAVGPPQNGESEKFMA